jgi:rRNA maturation RNase YbeY
MPARFHQADIDAKLKDKRKLSTYLDVLIKKYLKKVNKSTLDYIFCTDEHLLGMNQQFLKHNTLTDVITFDLSENAEGLKGEIYISVERVRENALKFGVSYSEELHRVIFHGALHLCGFKDKKEADSLEMRKMEDRCLREYFKS